MYSSNKLGKITGSNTKDLYLLSMGEGSGYFHWNSLGNKGEANNPDIKYLCPNKCEGYKYYLEAGACPVCQLNLFPLGAECIFY